MERIFNTSFFKIKFYCLTQIFKIMESFIDQLRTYFDRFYVGITK